MKAKFAKRLLHGPLGMLVVPAVFGLSAGSGCAHQQAQKADQESQYKETVTKLESRLEEVERTNGRLNVRIEELEDQIFLLQDMTESNRIALRRRGYMQRGGYLTGPRARAQAPQPTPESYYGTGSPYGAQKQPQANTYQQPQRRRRKVTRIPLSKAQGGSNTAAAQQAQQAQNAQQAQRAEQARSQPTTRGTSAEDTSSGDEIVITEKQYQEFVGDEPARSPTRTKKPITGRKAQAPVTDEKLATSDEVDADDDKTRETKPPAPSAKDVDNPLDLYKTALSEYRGGNYARALSGFRAFLEAGPNSNYIDNALYWIGECHYGLGKYESATKFFQRVLHEQPDGNKVPDAMLKMSKAFERLGSPEKSRALLEKLTDRYPTTNAGRLGAQKLSELQN